MLGARGFSCNRQLSLCVGMCFAVSIVFAAIVEELKAVYSEEQLEVVFTSPYTGYVQTPNWDGKFEYPEQMNSCVNLTAPENHWMVMSFYSVWIEFDGHDELEFFEDLSCAGRTLGKIRGEYRVRPWVHKSNKLSFHFFSDSVVSRHGFRLNFAFYNSSHLPQKFSSGRWNCSLPDGARLQEIFNCNFREDCAGGEDERNCWYNANHNCPRRMLSFANSSSCYEFLRPPTGYTNWNNASDICFKRGGHLISLNTAEEWDNVMTVLRLFVPGRVFIGLKQDTPLLPEMYANSWQWTDENIAVFVRLLRLPFVIPPFCANYNLYGHHYFHMLTVEECDQREAGLILCEKQADSSDSSYISHARVSEIHVGVPPKQLYSTKFVECPKNHTTHSFLACDISSDCWEKGYGSAASCGVAMTPLPPSFTCQNEIERVPYTLVCDHRPDCNDDSDESFCSFPKCDTNLHFDCGNKQCIPRLQRCDGVGQCVNGVDEKKCVLQRLRSDRARERYFEEYHIVPPPKAVITFSTITRRFEGEVKQTCPESHFQCPGGGYCLPVYMRCNGVYDCPGREDEAECDSYTCPGFYRCRTSTICVHPEQLCDGVLQCPQYDDELLCGARPCPTGCTCYGLAFFCAKPFPAAAFPELRFLDASGSGMSPSDLANNSMLVFLSLARCDLTDLPALDLANLHTLDVSHNPLTLIRGNILQKLPHLRVFFLVGNPVTSLASMATTGVISRSLKMLDASRLPIEEIEQSVFRLFPNLQKLNLSHSGLVHLPTDGFQLLQKIRVLDLRGCPISELKEDLFFGLHELRTVYSDSYKLCCMEILPAGFNLHNCYAPKDEISTCTSLLGTSANRVILSLYISLALVCNLASLAYRLIVKRSTVSSNTDHQTPIDWSQTAFRLFVTSLSVSDLLMGLYLAIIGVADRQYLGSYLWKDTTWRQSNVCKLAGFLFVFSNQMSTFLMFHFSLELILALSFPKYNIVTRDKYSRLVYCLFWVAGLVLASIPLLPTNAEWKFHEQSSICVPLAVTSFLNRSYFGNLLILNVIIAVFTAIIYCVIFMFSKFHKESSTDAVSSKGTTDRTTNLSLRATFVARRLRFVVMSNCFRWFSVGFVGILASTDILTPSNTNTLVSLFILPLNAALDPLLYIYGIQLENARKARNERLQKMLLSRAKNKRTDKSVKPQAVCTKEHALKVIQTFIKERLLSFSQVKEHLM